MDGGAWWAAVHGVTKSRTWLSDFTFTFHFHALEKEMATHSSVLAWRIQGTGEPGRLPSMGSHRVGHDWSDLAAAAAGLCESGLGDQVWAHVVWFWGSVCFCVSVCFLRCFPLTQQLTISFLNTSHHHCTLMIHYLILSSAQPFLKFA